MTRFQSLLVSVLKYITLRASAFIFVYILVIHLLHFVSPAQNYFDQYLFSPSRLRFLFSLGFILALINLSLDFLQKKGAFISPLSLSLEEKIVLTATSVLLSFFYGRIFSSFRELQYPMYILIFIIFFLLIPQVINSFTQIKYKNLKDIVNSLLKFK
jgi:hypothetical protein